MNNSESNLYHTMHYYVIPFGINVSKDIDLHAHPSVLERSDWVVKDVKVLVSP